MKLSVNPNRMVLLRLRKRLSFAMRGHRLLKDKLEGLIKEFTTLVNDYKRQRAKVDTGLPDVLKSFLLAQSSSSKEVIEDALNFPKSRITVNITKKNIMNVKVPQLSIEGEIDLFSYGLMNTPVELDHSLNALKDIFPEILKLAELETAVRLIAQEIEKIRRRVNALEYFIIPQLQETIKFIISKLDEIERANTTRLMKIKDIIRADTFASHTK